MHQDYEKLFNYAEMPIMSANLFDSVMNRIKVESKAVKIRKNLIIFSVASICSLSATVVMVVVTQSDFSQSGFWQFFSLLFSDFGLMMNYWQNYILSLLGAFPATSMILLLGSLLIFVKSLAAVIKNFKKYQSYIKFNLIHKI
ncbi:MAG: hypothetical protein COU29_03135 [Candidatus Magasanikbacteria bacterium CG10_big_fil_rev_8_21_14_0_10_36_32]|uniref:Uncharacterized protein n=1 Tax=Candidatus Magasanikbacteria bacterium CG10_big_fil_rev_8_21_14_0_10_36_32 TaxID=1974646 RepID=A0A2M6W682_9BACT|nr:MAG: hypothetical protein COU29_03135 [Candidatus Magasanikbacteria bacterium CG10_big_fil_rev_8_21_14_0_10_36_32]